MEVLAYTLILCPLNEFCESFAPIVSITECTTYTEQIRTQRSNTSHAWVISLKTDMFCHTVDHKKVPKFASVLINGIRNFLVSLQILSIIVKLWRGFLALVRSMIYIKIFFLWKCFSSLPIRRNNILFGRPFTRSTLLLELVHSAVYPMQ